MRRRLRLSLRMVAVPVVPLTAVMLVIPVTPATPVTAAILMVTTFKPSDKPSDG